jgi:hypothetical protein
VKTKADGIRKAFDPNKTNTTNLAKSLGRSFDAIAMIYHWAYSGKMLKNAL